MRKLSHFVQLLRRPLHRRLHRRSGVEGTANLRFDTVVRGRASHRLALYAGMPTFGSGVLVRTYARRR
ncbi:hypothetical protein ACQEWB_33040 [Streptomyces sp. CA-249302]|uniref:hypothetical protein n=1 Tax=Streptomyces sp. CA-249302 TaxID=3240058 RepID=UPI003D8EC4C5